MPASSTPGGARGAGAAGRCRHSADGPDGAAGRRQRRRRDPGPAHARAGDGAGQALLPAPSRPGARHRPFPGLDRARPGADDRRCAAGCRASPSRPMCSTCRAATARCRSARPISATIPTRCWSRTRSADGTAIRADAPRPGPRCRSARRLDRRSSICRRLRPSRRSASPARAAPLASGCPQLDQQQVIAARLQRDACTPAAGRAPCPAAACRCRGPTTLMPWISILPAAGLLAAIRRSGSRPLLVTVKKPPARSGAATPARPGTVDFDRSPHRGGSRFGCAAEPFQHPASSISFSLRSRRAMRVMTDLYYWITRIFGHKTPAAPSARAAARRGRFGRTASAARSAPRSATPRRRGSSAG